MSVEHDVDDRAVQPPSAFEAVLGLEPDTRRRPNVSGDLPTVFQAAPMFRRTLVGYDRYQVDTYVQWAEDELVAADREREHLTARHLRACADLDEARQLLTHSAGGGEFLQLSRRIGSMLAAATDEAESIRVAAEAHRSTAEAQAKRQLGYARWRIAYAEDRAKEVATAATLAFRERAAEAARILEEAEQARRQAHTEAEARLLEVREIRQNAVQHAERIRQAAADEATAAGLLARDQIVGMLGAAREQRRRADDEAAATREALARDVATRYAALLAEVDTLEHRRAALRAEIELLANAATGPSRRRLAVHLPFFLDRLRWRTRSLRAP